MFKKTGKTTTLGVVNPPKDKDKKTDTQPKEDLSTKKPRENKSK